METGGSLRLWGDGDWWVSEALGEMDTGESLRLTGQPASPNLRTPDIGERLCLEGLTSGFQTHKHTYG